MRIESLSRADFASWDSFVNRSPHGTVFHFSWWLEAAGYDFEILIGLDATDQIVAGIPLPRKKRAGLTLFHSPPLTPYLGPIFGLPTEDGTPHKLYMMRHWGELLARAIKGFDSFEYSMGTSGPDLQGFLWAGFRAELAYTFQFNAGTGGEDILEGMTRTHRQKLEKAQHGGTIVEVGERIDVLLELNKQTFRRQGLALPYRESLVRRLWSAAHSQGNATLYMARSAEGTDVAGLLVVHDVRTSYQIISGVNSERRGALGGFLLTWRAIRDALDAGRTFDFEGSSLRGVEQYYRRWGAIATPVWHLAKAGSLRGAIARKLAEVWQRQARDSLSVGQ